MCFSATASFLTAGVTGAIGIVSMSRVSAPRELPLAATPLVFAVQQSIEGSLWLTLRDAPHGSIPVTLTYVFLLIAEVFWPIYAPLAVWLIEPSERRRQLMLLCLAAGVGVGGYLLWWILTHPHGAAIIDDHIVYVSETQHSYGVAIAYLAATGPPLVLSSRRAVFVLGTIILVGLVVAYALYWEAFVSVWCFFAAAASVVILCHFEWARRSRLRLAGA